MTIVLNTCYGGFHIPEAFAEAHGLDTYDDIDRTDAELIAFIKAEGDDGEYEEGCACLSLVELPENVTDWEISEYDGYESLIYVVDGKIYHG